jgi:hypothetical protein
MQLSMSVYQITLFQTINIDKEEIRGMMDDDMQFDQMMQMKSSKIDRFIHNR